MAVSEDTGRSVADREKGQAASSSVIAAIFLTLFKLIVGVMTGSLGILAEVAHSALDLVAAVVTFFAVRLSGRPADAEHTYGHGKVENLSALFETLLLLGTCVWIIYEAIERLFFKEVEVQASVWAFVVMVVAIGVDYSRSRLLYRTARKYDSQALEADALHFSTDIWSSSVVIAGLFLVQVAGWLNVPWLVKADAVAAMAVAGIVIWVSFRLGKRTVVALLDGVPASLQEDVSRAVRVPGVVEVLQVRVRRSGAESFADVRLSVGRDTPLERSHEIAEAAEEAVRRVLPGADVVVHVDPVRSDQEGLLTTVRMLAAQHGLGAHGIRAYDQARDRHVLELHLEVSDGLTVEEAHQQASAFEDELRTALPAVDEVITHIEPTGEALVRRPASGADDSEVLALVGRIAARNGMFCHPHDVSVRRVSGELQVAFHCTMAPGTPITEAHRITERIEGQLRDGMPGLGRVVIHVEPPNEEAVGGRDGDEA